MLTADSFTVFDRKNSRRTRTRWPTLPRGCLCARIGGHRCLDSKAGGTCHRTSGRMSDERRPAPHRRLRRILVRLILVQAILGFLQALLVSFSAGFGLKPNAFDSPRFFK